MRISPPPRRIRVTLSPSNRQESTVMMRPLARRTISARAGAAAIRRNARGRRRRMVRAINIYIGASPGFHESLVDPDAQLPVVPAPGRQLGGHEGAVEVQPDFGH